VRKKLFSRGQRTPRVRKVGADQPGFRHGFASELIPQKLAALFQGPLCHAIERIGRPLHQVQKRLGAGRWIEPHNLAQERVADVIDDPRIGVRRQRRAALCVDHPGMAALRGRRAVRSLA
jgi:hypothetical protein